MPELQTSYSDTITPGYAGMVANGETSNRISRTCEDSGGIGFGKAVFRGAGDNGCTAVQTLTAAGSERAGNTGTGTVTDEPTVEAGAKIGRYTLTLLQTSATGDYEVRDPDGEFVGIGAIATEFDAGGLTFTWANGGTMTVGDVAYIDVTGNAFLGVTIERKSIALTAGATADEYPRYENVNIMTQGSIYVEAGETVVAGNPVFVDTDGNFVDSGGVPCPGWVFDEGGSDGDAVIITRR